MNYKLPVMQCDVGCGECCGPVICKEHEYKQVAGYARNRGIEPLRQGLTCPFYQQGTCAVYDVRPHICRLFGHAEKLVCCRGYNRNIPPGHEAKIEREYMRDGGPTRWLHELAGYKPLEVLEMTLAELESA